MGGWAEKKQLKCGHFCGQTRTTEIEDTTVHVLPALWAGVGWGIQYYYYYYYYYYYHYYLQQQQNTY